MLSLARSLGSLDGSSTWTWKRTGRGRILVSPARCCHRSQLHPRAGDPGPVIVRPLKDRVARIETEYNKSEISWDQLGKRRVTVTALDGTTMSLPLSTRYGGRAEFVSMLIGTLMCRRITGGPSPYLGRSPLLCRCSRVTFSRWATHRPAASAEKPRRLPSRPSRLSATAHRSIQFQLVAYTDRGGRRGGALHGRARGRREAPPAAAGWMPGSCSDTSCREHRAAPRL